MEKTIDVPVLCVNSFVLMDFLDELALVTGKSPALFIEDCVLGGIEDFLREVEPLMPSFVARLKDEYDYVGLMESRDSGSLFLKDERSLKL